MKHLLALSLIIVVETTFFSTCCFAFDPPKRGAVEMLGQTRTVKSGELQRLQVRALKGDRDALLQLFRDCNAVDGEVAETYCHRLMLILTHRGDRFFVSTMKTLSEADRVKIRRMLEQAVVDSFIKAHPSLY